MKKHILIGLLLLVPWPVAAQIIQPGIIPGIMGCDYYASPTGSVSNDGKFPSRPFRIVDFWTVAGPGVTLCLLNGTYTGADHVIKPSAAVAGVSGNPVKIRALHEGGVFLNGQFLRSPVSISGTTVGFLTVEGIDACCTSPSGGVVSILDGAHDITIRRVCAFDSHSPSFPSGTGTMLLQAHSFTSDASPTRNILFEDVCAFGRSHLGLRHAYHAENVTFRRAWVRMEDGAEGEATQGVSANRNAGAATFENIIVNWDYHRGTAGTPGNMITTSSSNSSGVTRVLGSLFYRLAGQTANASTVSVLGNNPAADPFQVNHLVIAQPGFTRAITFGGCPEYPSGNCVNTSVNNLTTIAGNTPSIHASWTGTNRFTGTTLADVPSPWGISSGAASLCQRWIDGAVTNQPLWPWPMDARIQGAIQKARTIQTGTLSKLLVGGSVTAEIESILGAIPVACKN